MHPQIRRHLSSLRSQLLQSHKTQNYAEWVTANTRINNEAFTYVGHEYQEYILKLSTKIKDFSIRKPSQIGISELAMRWALAKLVNRYGFALIYIFPSYSFAQLYARARLDPIIQQSPEIQDQLDPRYDSSAAKRFRNGSMFYTRGASRSTQAISLPADCLFFDERDFCDDEDVVSTFTSRLTHSQYKETVEFSTPTTFNGPVSSAFNDAHVIHEEYITCPRCNHEFQADYYDHVRLPKFDDHLSTITHRTIQKHQLDLNSAFLQCPNPACKRPVDYSGPTTRQYRTNITPTTSHTHHAIQITPFAAPSFITPGDLIRTSLKYNNRKDFVNFSLGLPYEDATTGLSEEEILNAFITPGDGSDGELELMKSAFSSSPSPRIYGIDMGGKCAILQAIPSKGISTPTDEHPLIITEALYTPMPKLEQQMNTLYSANPTLTSVYDSMPYTDLIHRFQNSFTSSAPLTWGASFRTSQNLTGEMYTMKERSSDPDKALDAIKRIIIDRDQALDAICSLIRSRAIMFAIPVKSQAAEHIITHLQDLKRVKAYSKTGDLRYVWRKSQRGEDHFFFALLYLFFADKLKYTTSSPHIPH